MGDIEEYVPTCCYNNYSFGIRGVNGRVQRNDWVIRDAAGKFLLYKASDFDSIFERVIQ